MKTSGLGKGTKFGLGALAPVGTDEHVDVTHSGAEILGGLVDARRVFLR